jgi:DNA-binding MarR family transcriptional regulator
LEPGVKVLEKAAALDNPLEGMFGFELRRASSAVMMALTNELETLDLRPSEASLLMVIGDNPGCTQSDIGRAMRAQPANLVPLINRLTQAGAIERVPGEGRAISLHLTRRGATLLRQARAVTARIEARLVRGLSKSAQQQIVEALRLMTKNACCHD